MERFDIFSVQAGGGTLALCPCPGRSGDYPADLDVLLHWAPGLVVTMTTAQELADNGAGGLPDDLGRAGVAWTHFPVDDYETPGAKADNEWAALSQRAQTVLRAGGRVLVHCKGGCGRSGMAVLRIMIETGQAPEASLARLRAVRPCAVETEVQLHWAGLGA